MAVNRAPVAFCNLRDIPQVAEGTAIEVSRMVPAQVSAHGCNFSIQRQNLVRVERGGQDSSGLKNLDLPAEMLQKASRTALGNSIAIF